MNGPCMYLIDFHQETAQRLEGPIHLTQMPLTGETRKLIRDLFEIGQSWNRHLECLRNGHRVYLPHWGPMNGFLSIDYIHGIVSGRPMAQLDDEDETNTSVLQLWSAMPDKWLFKTMTFLKKRVKRYIAIKCCSCETVLKQKFKHTGEGVVTAVLKYVSNMYIPKNPYQ